MQGAWPYTKKPHNEEEIMNRWPGGFALGPAAALYTTLLLGACDSNNGPPDSSDASTQDGPGTDTALPDAGGDTTDGQDAEVEGGDDASDAAQADAGTTDAGDDGSGEAADAGADAMGDAADAAEEEDMSDAGDAGTD
jgi:hypothetical protein